MSWSLLDSKPIYSSFQSTYYFFFLFILHLSAEDERTWRIVQWDVFNVLGLEVVRIISIHSLLARTQLDDQT